MLSDSSDQGRLLFYDSSHQTTSDEAADTQVLFLTFIFFSLLSILSPFQYLTSSFLVVLGIFFTLY